MSRRHLPWLGLVGGLLLGGLDLALLQGLGVAMIMDGVDATVPVMGMFACSFGGLGYAIGRLAQARGQLRQDAQRIAQQQEQLIQAEKMAGLGRMAAGVAHEVRNPLAVMRSSASLIEEGLPERAAEERQAAQFIIEEVDRLDGFVRRVLDLSRAIRPQAVAIDVPDLLARSIARSGLSGITITSPEGGTIHGDPDLMTAVLTGLLINASQHRAGAIEVCAGAGWITVADDGDGISPDVAQALFEPFVTTRPQGTGLGLAMARRILEAHGGQIALRPGEGLSGRGACFAMSLPGRGA